MGNLKPPTVFKQVGDDHTQDLRYSMRPTLTSTMCCCSSICQYFLLLGIGEKNNCIFQLCQNWNFWILCIVSSYSCWVPFFTLIPCQSQLIITIQAPWQNLCFANLFARSHNSIDYIADFYAITEDIFFFWPK